MEKNPIVEMMTSWQDLQQQVLSQWTGQQANQAMPGPQQILAVTEQLARQAFDFQERTVRFMLEHMNAASPSQPGVRDWTAEITRITADATSAQRHAFEAWCNAVREIQVAPGSADWSKVTTQAMHQWQAATTI